MTTLEVILLIILWIILGLFIASKRDWYKASSDSATEQTVFAVIFAPINFLVTFTKIYLIDKWNND